MNIFQPNELHFLQLLARQYPTVQAASTEIIRLRGILNLPKTVGLGILNALTIFLCVRFVIPLFFLPALSALLGSLLIEPMFKPYMEAAE